MNLAKEYVEDYSHRRQFNTRKELTYYYLGLLDKNRKKGKKCNGIKHRVLSLINGDIKE